MSDERLVWMGYANAVFFLVPHRREDGVVCSWKLDRQVDALIPVPSAWQTSACAHRLLSDRL